MLGNLSQDSLACLHLVSFFFFFVVVVVDYSSNSEQGVLHIHAVCSLNRILVHGSFCVVTFLHLVFSLSILLFGGG